TEDEQKDEEVINAERFLDNIASSELQRLLAASAKVDEHGKGSGQQDPKDAPRHGLAELDGARLAVKDQQVQRQQHQHPGIKDDPEPDSLSHLQRLYRRSLCLRTERLPAAPVQVPEDKRHAQSRADKQRDAQHPISEDQFTKSE